MDLRTVMLMLGFGSFLFGLLLVILKFKRNEPQQVPFWITAKFLQAIGSFILYFKTDTFDGVTLFANIILLLGCAYETWVIRILSGYNVKRLMHLIISLLIVLGCISTIKMSSISRSGVIFLFQSIFYFLPSIFLINNNGYKSYFKAFLGGGYFLSGIVFFVTSIICMAFPTFALSVACQPLFGVIPTTSFCIFLISGFILLMLAKERSDMLVREMKKSLKKSESRFQKIVETAIEGILIFDENYHITFANKNMASRLGYQIEELLGKPVIIFFPEEKLDIYHQQEAMRKTGADSVYECPLLRKDGESHWFLISAKALIDDNGKFEGSFAMLTDINHRKEMEILLEESNRRLEDLSNKDGLTGIANRRKFDEVLDQEYNRLSRSKLKLSVILLDIDYFKEYNDYYGHVMGDECLRQIGNILSENITRTVDLAARYGGEEFACILPDTELKDAVKIARKIQKALEDLKIEHLKSWVAPYVTASLGVITVQYAPTSSPIDIVEKVDHLMYKAKAGGRNKIEYAEWNDIVLK